MAADGMLCSLEVSDFNQAPLVWVRVTKAAVHADHSVSPGDGLEAAPSSLTYVIRMPDTLSHQELSGALNS